MPAETIDWCGDTAPGPCSHPDARKVLNEDESETKHGATGAEVWMCPLCQLVLFLCTYRDCQALHQRRSPYCSSSCASKAREAERVAGARRTWED